jgi:VIT1/CCC1 family predicted Fe2+/Mn2+ transporter
MNGDAIDANANMMLGRLLAEVANLREDFRRSEDKSDLSRSAVRRRMDELVSQVGGLETVVATATNDIKEMKPITEDVQR